MNPGAPVTKIRMMMSPFESHKYAADQSWPISHGRSRPSISRWFSARGRSILGVCMIGPIVLPPQNPENQRSGSPLLQPGLGSSQRMDPLSEVLALMKPQVYVAGGFSVLGDMAIHFPKHQGIKCYAMLAGQCWLVVEGVPEPVLLHAGDCFLLPRGLPFRLATDLSLEPVSYTDAFARLGMRSEAPGVSEGA